MPLPYKCISTAFTLLALSLGACSTPTNTSTTKAPEAGVSLHILGSGGPELDDGRASSGYAVWLNDESRLIIDLGSGTLLNFEKAQGDIAELDAILFTHFHVDHSADLPSLVKASYFTSRTDDLPIYGPTGNSRMPGAAEFVGELFDAQGAYRYLKGYITLRERYQLLPQSIDHTNKTVQTVLQKEDLSIQAIAVNHGPIPALAWRINLAGKSIVISGDMSGQYNTLETLAQDADILVAHNAVPESATGVARRLHMPPSKIGEIAAKAGVKQLVLSHRMKRTNHTAEETLATIRKHYQGPVFFAEDGDFFKAN